MPIRQWVPVPAKPQAMAACTSPSEIGCTRAPVERISAIRSLWRARSITTITRSLAGIPSASLRMAMFSVADLRMSTLPLAAGGAASFFM